MAKYRRRRTRRSHSKRTRRSGKKPIGFTRAGKSYRLVFGSRTKPKLGKKTYKTKRGLINAARKYFKRKR